MAQPGAPPAGWLLDPDDPSLLRWWDGTAWGGFRRERSPSPAPVTPVGPPAPAAPPAPAIGPEPFTAQFDHQVMTILGALDGATRGRRATVYAAIRERVLATASPYEQVVDACAVSIHDEHRSRTRLGPARVEADLFVTDRRLLLVVEDMRPDDALVDAALEDVLAVTGLADGGLAVALVGDGPPLLLRAEQPARREPLQRLVVSVLERARPASF